VSMLRSDAPLTRKGKRQARALRDQMSKRPFEIIVVSPLSRTIQTATEIFGQSDVPKCLCHLMCERSMMPSDTGTPSSELISKHPHVSSWSGLCHLPEEYWPKVSGKKAAEKDVAERVEHFKTWLLARPETCMALVGHSAFFRTMTGQPKLGNCEAFWCELRANGDLVPCSPLPEMPASGDESDS